MQKRFDRHLKEMLHLSGVIAGVSDISASGGVTMIPERAGDVYGSVAEGKRSLRVIAGVSGGADSVCMLRLLCGSSLNLQVSVAHMNFSLRGVESDDDEVFVKKLAKSEGVPFFSKRVNTHEYAEHNSLSIEMAARELRYNWFYELMQSQRADFLAIAHNANDNAETLLLNLTRGTGLRGICGIMEYSKFTLMGKNVEIHVIPQTGREFFNIIRPLLIFSRDEIESFLLNHRLKFRVDRTNADIEFSRNRIRNVVLPELAKINPSIVERLNNNISHFNAVRSFMESVMPEYQKSFLSFGAGCFNGHKGEYLQLLFDEQYLRCCIDIAALLGSSEAGLLLFESIERYGFNADIIEGILDSARRTGEARKFFTEGYVAVVERGKIKIYDGSVVSLPESRRIDDFLPVSSGVVNSVAECKKEVSYGDFTILFSSVSCAAHCKKEEISGGRELRLSAEALKFPLLIRPVRNGDRFTPFGMTGSKLVQDYLAGTKFDNIYKSLCPVITDSAGDILCLPGIEISESFKVGRNNDRAIYLSVCLRDV